MKWLLRLSFAAFVALATSPVVIAEPVADLHPTNYVNDFAHVLDAATQTTLNDVARQLDEKAKAQISVVTVKSTDGQDITGYAVALYQQWGIGKKGTDRGVLILLAVQDRKYSVNVGYGLEAILPDGKVGGFGREAVPLLRTGDYSGAVSLITLRVANVIAQDAGVTLEGAQAPERSEPADAPHGRLPGIVFAIVLVVVFLLIARVLSGGGGGRGSGGGSGFLSGLLWGILFNSLSGGGRGSSGGSSWGGGFGGGGGGFGGFGGGSTGGGGAGGSW